MRALGTALASVIMALGALGLAVAAPLRGQPEAPAAAVGDASGALLISNSRAGEAVFSAPPMRPGETVSGAVRIGNAGQVGGRFSMGVTGVHDTPGPYGGRLSERVQLALVDTTGAPVMVYAGDAAGFGDVDLGTLAPGAQRDYRLSATLPDGGVPADGTLGDNVFQGAALSLDLEWRAVATDDGSGGGGSTGGGSAGGGAPPATGSPDAGEVSELEVLGETLGLPSANRCVSRRGMRIRLRAPGGIRVLAATVRINGKLKKRVERFKQRTVKLTRLPARRFRLTVRVRAASKRVYVSKRVYRPCKAAKQKRSIDRGWRKRQS
jgi:hypothetical protein